MKFTNNIYNDFESYKYKNIKHNIDVAILNNQLMIDKNITINNTYELQILVNNHIDPFYYTFNNVNELLQAAYFIWLLDKKIDTIIDYKIWVNDEVSYIFDYWKTNNEMILNTKINTLENKLTKIEGALSKYNLTIDELLKKTINNK